MLTNLKKSIFYIRSKFSSSLLVPFYLVRITYKQGYTSVGILIYSGLKILSRIILNFGIFLVIFKGYLGNTIRVKNIIENDNFNLTVPLCNQTSSHNAPSSANENISSLVINSPIEVTEMVSSSPPAEGPCDQRELILSLLKNDLVLHFCLIHLMCILIFIFTIKLIADKNLYTPNIENKVKSIPLGYYINLILTKLIANWRISSYIWIYMIMIGVVFFLFISSFGVFCVYSALS